ncbi:MAG: lysophospholipid acyltransferase family protein [Mailhella sp.]|nr:lysophospholipid acyltransferase family protein [Mailhella sp.]
MTALERLRFLVLRCLGAAIGSCGFRGIRFLGGAVGGMIWLAVPGRRALATRNVHERLGLPPGQAADVARESFRSAGRAFLEMLLTRRFGFDDPHLRMDPPDSLDRLRACGRPIVAATAHFGAWELLASLLGQLYEEPRPRLVVVRKYSDPAVHAFIEGQRQAKGAQMVGHRQAAMTVLRALRKNAIAAFLVDHNTKPEEAVFLPFLGKEAAVNLGPAVLAVRAKALIWPVALAREGRNYVFRTQEPMDTAMLDGNFEERVFQAAEFYTRAVEHFVRREPEQWFWMHDRWKTRPGQPAAAGGQEKDSGASR